MSIQSYALPDNLPAPVTSGTTIQTFQDVTGEWWIAKNGVYSGAWKRARAVLHACVGRAGAFTPPTAMTLFGWDTIITDTYGLYVGSPTYGFVVPVAGWYYLNAQWYGAIATLGEYEGIRLQGGPGSATILTAENMIENVANGGCNCKSTTTVVAAANDTFTMQYMQSTAGTGTAGVNCRFFMSYLGST
jgi:hypothetical protein